MKKLSPAQSNAFIDNKNLCLLASAGSGKTFVLERKYIYYLAQKENNNFINQNQIVAITFTEKAAAEMKKRIYDNIKEIIENDFNFFSEAYHFIKLNKNDFDSFKEHLKNIKEKFFNVNISTIHSFCLKLLGENFLETNITPDVKINNDIDNNIIFNSLFKKVFYNFIKNPDNFYSLQILLNDLSFYTFKKLCFYLLERKEIFDNLQQNYEFLYKIQKDVIEYLSKKKKFNLSDDNLSDDNLSDDNLSDDNEILYNNSIFSINKEGKLVQNLLYFVKSLVDEYFEEQSKKNFLSFNDILYLTNKNLKTNKHLAQKLAERYKYIIIDEMQDTDPLQWEIIKKILEFNQTKIFIVSDEKQSIYKFRGADITIFKESQKYINNIKELSENRRSTKNLIKFFNQYFSWLFYDDDLTYGVKYTNASFLENKNQNNNQQHKILFDEKLKIGKILKKTSSSDNELNQDVNFIFNLHSSKKNKFDLKVSESYLCAQIIKNILTKKVDGFDFVNSLLSENKPVIAILLRRFKYLPLFEMALKVFDIEYNVSTDRFILNNEISLYLFNYLKFLYCNDDISLVGTLRSALFMLKDSTLFLIATKTNNTSFYNKIISFLKNEENKELINDEEKNKIINFLQITKKLQKYVKYYKVSELIKIICDETNLLEKIYLSNKNYETYLSQFIYIVKEFENRNSLNFTDLFDFIEEIINNENNNLNIILEENNKPVQILSYFKAKGLEFPIIILPDLDYSITSKEKIFISKISDYYWSDNRNYYIGLKVRDEKNDNREVESTIRLLLKDEIKRMTTSEEKRLLYVAFTRAINKLIPIFSLDNYIENIKKIKNIEKKEDCKYYYELILKYFFENDYEIYFDDNINQNDFIINYSIDENFIQQNIDKFKYFLNNFESFKNPDDLNFLVSEINTKICDEKIKLNANNLFQFVQCPFIYYFRNQLNYLSEFYNNEVSSNNSIIIGNLTHQILKNNEYENLFNLNKINITQKIEDYLIKNRLTINNASEIYSRLTFLFDNFLNSNYLNDLLNENIYHKTEYRLHYSNEKYIIKIIIDRINFYENSIDIIDYKTNYFENENELNEIVKTTGYDYQLGLYYYVINKLFPDKNINTYLIFLNKKNCIVKNCHKKIEEIDNVINQIINFHQNNLNHNFNIITNCISENCNYKNLCEKIFKTEENESNNNYTGKS